LVTDHDLLATAFYRKKKTLVAHPFDFSPCNANWRPEQAGLVEPLVSDANPASKLGGKEESEWKEPDEERCHTANFAPRTRRTSEGVHAKR
jgi:hypothetical protein